jgi:hypothetical protein
MSQEIWLRSNRRPALVAMGATGLVFAASVISLLWMAPWKSGNGFWGPISAGLAGALAGLAMILAWRKALRPRMWRMGDRLQMNFGKSRPLDVPLEVVEAFFLGRGPAQVPGRFGDRLVSVNLVARVSERATQWRQRDVDPRIGTWCDGYITFRGTYCEPLHLQTVHRLNSLLTRAKRESQSDG